VRIRDKNKLAHEKAVVDELLDRIKIKPSDSRPGNPDQREPDIIYRIEEKTVGVEVVCAYYTEDEAKATAEAAAEKPLAADEVRPGKVIGSPDDSICDAIKECLDEKCKKAYSGTDETWLCIHADATITESVTIEECAKNLNVPNHGFARIFVAMTKSENEGGSLAVFEIPPTQK